MTDQPPSDDLPDDAVALKREAAGRRRAGGALPLAAIRDKTASRCES